MTLRYAGVTREMLRNVWSSASPVNTPASKPAIYDSRSILAFSIGNPSEAFGEPYRIFDKTRRIARLPGPPYLFLDRITEVQGEPFKLTAGSSAEAQYDVPPNEWYFGVNRQGDMARKASEEQELAHRGIHDVIGIALCFAALLIAVALLSYEPHECQVVFQRFV